MTKYLEQLQRAVRINRLLEAKQTKISYCVSTHTCGEYDDVYVYLATANNTHHSLYPEYTEEQIISEALKLYNNEKYSKVDTLCSSLIDNKNVYVLNKDETYKQINILSIFKKYVTVSTEEGLKTISQDLLYLKEIK